MEEKKNVESIRPYKDYASLATVQFNTEDTILLLRTANKTKKSPYDVIR